MYFYRPKGSCILLFVKYRWTFDIFGSNVDVLVIPDVNLVKKRARINMFMEIVKLLQMSRKQFQTDFQFIGDYNNYVHFNCDQICRYKIAIKASNSLNFN